jgi:hypothetical protein
MLYETKPAFLNVRFWIVLVTTTIFIFSISMLVETALASEETYATFSTIKKEAQEGWQQTYTFNGETIDVDVEIEVPDVEVVPIVQVRCVGELSPVNAPENADISLYPKEGFAYSVESRPGTISAESTKGMFRWLQDYSDNAQAENSPLNREEAIAFVQKVIAPYVDKCGSFSYEVRRIFVESRGYKVVKSDSSGETLDYSITCTDMGVYQITFNQTFHGIPFLALNLPFTWPLKVEEGLFLAVGQINAIVGSEKDYFVAFHPVVEDAVLAQDIPLTSFADIKKEFEKLIESGYIRKVNSVRLEYCFFNNPDDMHNTYILLPVWELNGVYVQNPKDPTPPPTFEDSKTEALYGGMPGYVNAQTGKYLNPEDKTPTRSYGTYITWDEVK